MTELYRPKQQAIQDDKHYCELRYEQNTSFVSGLQDRPWSTPTLTQGPNNGISLAADNAPQINFKKKGVYRVNVSYRAFSDIWQKWGMRSDDNVSIVGEGSFYGGSAGNTGSGFLITITDLSQAYKFFTVCTGVMTIQSPVPGGGNIGTADRTITATITEVKRLD